MPPLTNNPNSNLILGTVDRRGDGAPATVGIVPGSATIVAPLPRATTSPLIGALPLHGLRLIE
jgi:hypothetical protein